MQPRVPRRRSLIDVSAVIERPPAARPLRGALRAIHSFGKAGCVTRHLTMRCLPFRGYARYPARGKKVYPWQPGRTLLDRNAYEFDR